MLVSSRQPAHQVGYVDQLVGDDSAGKAPGGVQFEFREALQSLNGVDVVHLTATSAVVGDRRVADAQRTRRARRFARAVRRRRIALVRTVYGDEPWLTRPASPAEAVLDRATAAYIVMSPTTAAPHGREATVIPHSHLRDRFLGYPLSPAVPGRILFISAGVFPAAYEAPLKVVAIADLPECTLRLVGQISSALLKSFNRTISRHPATISLRDEPLSDAARIEEITGAEIVAIASPDSYESHRTLMLALSLNRPVLVESTPATRVLADEVGHDWVRLHEGRLTAATLENAIHALRAAPPAGCPNLDARDPNVIAANYATLFRAVKRSR
ncbi:hypothetical protein [Microbacterium sp. 2FI]|uniref:hypothetical protein n=1 Tax=Microbacterium sp. 2FI TaxID=2502193 RepID=UPI0010F6F2CA|nr:hypothetical protein [Microbacterium sp. 2FI]